MDEEQYENWIKGVTKARFAEPEDPGIDEAKAWGGEDKPTDSPL